MSHAPTPQASSTQSKSVLSSTRVGLSRCTYELSHVSPGHLFTRARIHFVSQRAARVVGRVQVGGRVHVGRVDAAHLDVRTRGKLEAQGIGTRPKIEETLTITPRPSWSKKCGNAAWEP